MSVAPPATTIAAPPAAVTTTPPATATTAASQAAPKLDLAMVPKESVEEDMSDATPATSTLASLKPLHKSFLLFCFCLSMFIDAAGVGAAFLMTAPIAHELNIGLSNQAWILASYALSFACALLFAGRLADLFPPNMVYTVGLFGLGVLSLVISFLRDQYSFFILRALSGLVAVLTIPSSINMIVQMYPDPLEQAKKLALFGLASALANVFAFIIAGVFMLASWRWYFRFVTIVVVPFAVLTWFMLPRTEAVAGGLRGGEKWKRMDLGGVFMMFAMVILFILAFTQGPVDGWNKPIFIAPLVVSVVMLPLFLWWEQRLPVGYALLPHGIWKFRNIFPLMLMASTPFFWFATYQLRLATWLQESLHNSPILTAAKILPMGAASVVIGLLTQPFPWLITRPKYVQPAAAALVFAGTMLIAFSNGGAGTDFWRWILPSEIIGVVGAMIIFVGMTTNITQAFPREFAGVGGSFAQVILQISGVVGIAVQTALLTTGTDPVTDWTGSRNGYFFTGGYVMLCGLVFLLWYKEDKAEVKDVPPV